MPDGTAAPSADTTTTAAPTTQAPATIVAPAAPPIAQIPPAPPKPFELPENLKKLADDPNFFSNKTREQTLAQFRAAGIKIPREVRESGTFQEVLQAASERVSEYKSGGKKAKEANQALSRARDEITKLSQETATIAFYAQAELGAMTKEQSAAFKRAVGVAHDKDVPPEKSGELLRAIAMARSIGLAQPVAPPAPPAAPTTQVAPPAPPAPLPAPQPTAPPGAAPPPPTAGTTAPTIREQYAALRRAADNAAATNPHDQRPRIAASVFAMQHARELSRSIPIATNPASQAV